MKYKIKALLFTLILAGCFEEAEMADKPNEPPAVSSVSFSNSKQQTMERKIQTTQPVQTAGIQVSDCSNLHRVADIDDLVCQIYDNLDSLCLFELNKQKLADIWGVYNN